MTLHVAIAGIVSDSGTLAQLDGLLLISTHDYCAAIANTPLFYSNVYVATVDDGHSVDAQQAIQKQFPQADMRLASDLLKRSQDEADLIAKFLKIVGLLACSLVVSVLSIPCRSW